MPQSHREHDFYSIPKWFPSSTTTTSLLSWLPLRPEQFEATKPSSESPDVVMLEEQEQEIQEEDIQEQVESCSPSPLDPLAIDEAAKLKVALSNSDSTSQTLRISRQVRNVCLAAEAGRRLAMLELIRPWEADDETLSVLLSGLCNDDGAGKGDTDWPVHVLCSVSLPAFLTLTSPASRVLLSATIGFCKLHPVAAVEALAFPLALSGKGINVAVCDVLARVVKECLHPAHVSAFCQRLLCGKDKGRRVVCLPCHRGLISDAVVWTESMFTLFQQILNLGVYLTPDTAHQLVLVIDEVAEKFSRSLKFGNFLLCFVTKCVRAVEFHKALLESAAKKTDTFVTKSILSKLEVH
ncbi:uncharacterized protein M6B38_302635 [Iris pallida]|uniref:Fanconi Anaemia group E protein C-terminal domain-containing protein n=1 Tax=Iris pallida TaxID=29817 RepID=A0AAX6HNT6_IRIPA|nr:uncharacterized protein M6B38_302635 [Iris pallida]